MPMRRGRVVLEDCTLPLPRPTSYDSISVVFTLNMHRHKKKNNNRAKGPFGTNRMDDLERNERAAFGLHPRKCCADTLVADCCGPRASWMERCQ